MTPFYAKPLDTPWVIEVIGERFDSAINLMTSDSVVYGGAIRDTLAELSLEGDLDISVSKAGLQILLRTFQSSVRWTMTMSGGRPVRTPHVKPNSKMPSDNITYRKSSAGGKMALSSSNLLQSSFENSKTYPKSVPINSSTTFSGIGDIKVQIMSSRADSGDLYGDAVMVARKVDIRCCGVIMNSDGDVFEVVEGAYDDCKNRELHINEISSLLDVERLKQRIAKLEKRGWKNRINVKKVEKEVSKLVAEDRHKKKAGLKRVKAKQAKMQKKAMADVEKRAKLSGKRGKMATLSPEEQELFTNLRLAPDTTVNTVYFNEITHVGVDSFVDIMQDACEEGNITAQVHPMIDRLLIETMTASDADILFESVWTTVDEGYGQQGAVIRDDAPEDDAPEPRSTSTTTADLLWSTSSEGVEAEHDTTLKADTAGMAEEATEPEQASNDWYPPPEVASAPETRTVGLLWPTSSEGAEAEHDTASKVDTARMLARIDISEAPEELTVEYLNLDDISKARLTIKSGGAIINEVIIPRLGNTPEEISNALSAMKNQMIEEIHNKAEAKSQVGEISDVRVHLSPQKAKKVKTMATMYMGDNEHVDAAREERKKSLNTARAAAKLTLNRD